MNTILVTGSKGQLGKTLQALVQRNGNTLYHWVFTDYESLDITNLQQVQSAFDKYKPKYCINCAAYTQVDQAESEQERAFAINKTGVENLALSSVDIGTTMIHISTDYVFSGKYYSPLGEQTVPDPLGIYGKSKLAGEERLAQICPQHVTIRTSWLYADDGHNFVKTMLRLGKSRPEISVVGDQIGSPTYARDLALAIIQIINKLEETPNELLYGLYHYSNEGVASWYDFAQAIMELADIDVLVKNIPTSSYPTPAQRPAYSVMDKHKIIDTFGVEIPYWRSSLARCLQNIL